MNPKIRSLILFWWWCSTTGNLKYWEYLVLSTLVYVNTGLSYKSSVSLIILSPRETSTFVHQKIRTSLFTIAKSWKQLKQLSTEEWTRKLWSSQIKDPYTAIKSNNQPLIARNMDESKNITSSKKKKKGRHKKSACCLYLKFQSRTI